MSQQANWKLGVGVLHLRGHTGGTHKKPCGIPAPGFALGSLSRAWRVPHANRAHVTCVGEPL